jgi:hypothetical protein
VPEIEKLEEKEFNDDHHKELEFEKKEQKEQESEKENLEEKIEKLEPEKEKDEVNDSNDDINFISRPSESLSHKIKFEASFDTNEKPIRSRAIGEKMKTPEEYSRIENEYLSEADSMIGFFDTQKMSINEKPSEFMINLSCSREDMNSEKDKESISRKKVVKGNTQNTPKEIIVEDVNEYRPSNINDYISAREKQQSARNPFERRKVSVEEILQQYFLKFSQIPSMNMDHMKFGLVGVDEEKMRRIKEDNKDLYICSKEAIYEIYDAKVSTDVINLYLSLLNKYNKFLVKNNLLKTNVRFVDIEFFKLLQEIYVSDKNYYRLLEEYKNILFQDDFFFTLLDTQVEFHILIVPIFLENPFEAGSKSLFLAKFNFNGKSIVMYDACDILFKDQSISKSIN